jgi:hypothetical protein
MAFPERPANAELTTRPVDVAPGYTLTYGESINNDGQILADGVVNATGQQVAFIFTPAVPAPAAAWLLLSGLGGLAAFARKGAS